MWSVGDAEPDRHGRPDAGPDRPARDPGSDRRRDGCGAQRHPVRIAAVSLCDVMQFGLLTDPDLVPSTDTLATGIEASVAELLAA